ncbi:MAG: hypothetical protein ABJR05_06415 [Balneola sp.]
MRLSILVSITLAFFFNANVKAQKITLEKVKEFALPNGYDCNLLDVVQEEIVITCPRTSAFYHSINGEDLKEISYNIGRGPGELSRVPFGIGILKDHIVFSDPDLQRMFIYDKKTKFFFVKRIKLDRGLSFIYSTDYDSLIFIRNKALEGIGYMYNLNTGKLSDPFLKDKPFENAFLQDGRVEVQGDVLLFGSLHEGYVSIWDLKKYQQIKKYQLFKNKNIEERSAQMNGLSGFIPPNSENKIQGVGLYEQGDGRQLILTLIESRANEFDMNKLYVFDTIKEQFVSEIKLESEGDMFEISGDYLYVHYEDRDKLVKYKLSAK